MCRVVFHQRPRVADIAGRQRRIQQFPVPARRSRRPVRARLAGGAPVATVTFSQALSSDSSGLGASCVFRPANSGIYSRTPRATRRVRSPAHRRVAHRLHEPGRDMDGRVSNPSARLEYTHRTGPTRGESVGVHAPGAACAYHNVVEKRAYLDDPLATASSIAWSMTNYNRNNKRQEDYNCTIRAHS